jgi:serine/threonine protein kinase
MELVEGDDLSELIARGHLPLGLAQSIAKQMAEALEAAHDAAVIHRDLKPANIKVRADGTVKVLDFGLAKLGNGDANKANAAQSPTVTSPAMTHEGIILGTAAYMSPEQASGKPLDARTDVWAFGCVLYEMLTGRPAFTGDSVSEVLASVLAREPDLTALPAAAPPSIRRLIRRCLQKNRTDRLRDIGDAWLEIVDAGTGEQGMVAQPTRGRDRSRERAAWMAAIAVLSVVSAT